MMGKNRSKSDSLIRRKPYREPRKRFLIVCGGSVTEPSYFEGVRQTYRDRLIRLDIIPGTRAPDAIVAQAVTLNEQENACARDDFDRFDEVWCVFDKDEFELSTTINMAETNGVLLAVSNPCFELWLILHFQDQRAHLTAVQARRLCQKWLPSYDKQVEFDKVWRNIKSAVERAQALDKLHLHNGRKENNPSSGVYRLMQRIEQSQLRRMRL